MNGGGSVTARAGRIVAGALLVALAACQPLPLRTSLPVEVRPSPNFDERRPNFVILHHTGDEDAARALMVLADPLRKVSAHYLIARDGTIYYLVDEQARAWHAGDSYWGGNRDLNSASIGIELVNNGDEPFPGPQIAALTVLLKDLKGRYRIPVANFLGHGDVAPGRKVDPSRWFPWRQLAEQGFGLWCDAPPAADSGNDTRNDDMLMLRAFGYDVKNPAAAIGAFKRRFMPDDPSSELTVADRAVLHCLLALKNGGGAVEAPRGNHLQDYP